MLVDMPQSTNSKPLVEFTTALNGKGPVAVGVPNAVRPPALLSTVKVLTVPSCEFVENRYLPEGSMVTDCGMFPVGNG